MAIKINFFHPHDIQRKIINALENPLYTFVTVAAGRRIGKSALNLNYITKYSLDNPGSKNLFVVPSHNQLATAFNEWCRYFEKAPFVLKINRSEYNIVFQNYSAIKFRIGSMPAGESLRGEAFDLIIIDEAAMIDEKLWNEILSPTLATSKKQPKVLFTSTPRGHDWFKKMYDYGQDPSKKKYYSIHAPSSASPYVNKDYLEDMRASLPDKTYRQEILAEFLQNAGALFVNIHNNLIDPKKHQLLFNNRNEYFAGIDIGLINDYSVVVIIDSQGIIVDYIRFNDVEMKECAKRINTILKKWNYPLAYLEVNQWQGILDMLRDIDCENVQPFVTTAKSKKEMINNLCNVFEQNKIKIPDDKYIISEFEAFKYTYNPRTRNTTFAAPEGLHDDFIIATAIAFEAKNKLSNFNFSFI